MDSSPSSNSSQGSDTGNLDSVVSKTWGSSHSMEVLVNQEWECQVKTKDIQANSDNNNNINRILNSCSKISNQVSTSSSSNNQASEDQTQTSDFNELIE